MKIPTRPNYSRQPRLITFQHTSNTCPRPPPRIDSHEEFLCHLAGDEVLGELHGVLKLGLRLAGDPPTHRGPAWGQIKVTTQVNRITPSLFPTKQDPMAVIRGHRKPITDSRDPRVSCLPPPRRPVRVPRSPLRSCLLPRTGSECPPSGHRVHSGS